jgi:hypothetical protein
MGLAINRLQQADNSWGYKLKVKSKKSKVAFNVWLVNI